MSDGAVSRRPRNYLSGENERVGQGFLEGLVSAPELSVGGEGAFRTGLVPSTPELYVGGEGLLLQFCTCRYPFNSSYWGRWWGDFLSITYLGQLSLLFLFF